MFLYRKGSKRDKRYQAKLKRLYEAEVGPAQKVELTKAEMSRYKVKYDTAVEAVRAARHG